MTRALIYYCVSGLLLIGLAAGCASDVEMGTADSGGLGTSETGRSTRVPNQPEVPTETDGPADADDAATPEPGGDRTIKGGGLKGSDNPTPGGNGVSPEETSPSTPAPTIRDNSRERIQSAFRLPDKRVAYIGEATSFPGVSGDFAELWSWAWDVGGNGNPEGRDAGGFSYTFTRLGPQSLVVTAERADYQPLRWSTDLLVTVSQSELNRLVGKLVTQAVAVEASQEQADEDKLAATVQELQRYTDSGVKIRVRGEGIMNYREFSDLVYADLGIEKNFSGVASYEYDPATGKVIDLTLR